MPSITQKTIEEILLTEIVTKELQNKREEILGIYVWGSRLYGMDNENSDLYYCIVVSQGMLSSSYIQIETKKLDLHIMTTNEYERRLREHDMMVLECYFQDSPIKKYEVEFELDLQILRKSISSVTNNSWVKAKKKIILEDEDSSAGLKSYYHCFRILNFGTQIAKHGKIINYSYGGAMSPVRDKDVNNIKFPKWEYWNEKLKPHYNKAKTEFKKVSPKTPKTPKEN